MKCLVECLAQKVLRVIFLFLEKLLPSHACSSPFNFEHSLQIALIWFSVALIISSISN